MRRALAILVGASWLCGVAAAAPDERLAGTLTSVGSDTASALVTHWAAAFHCAASAGSASRSRARVRRVRRPRCWKARPTSTLSRPMNAAEAAAARARHGYAPLQLMVARDAIAVFVHPDNPLARITLADVDAIFSSTRRCGAPHAIRHWRELGLPAGGTLDRAGLLATGRDASSGTHEVFRETALCGGEFRPDVIAWPGNGAVVATVAGNREAIGYAGIGYVNGLVKPLALARDAADGGTAPSVANVASGRYRWRARSTSMSIAGRASRWRSCRAHSWVTLCPRRGRRSSRGRFRRAGCR